MEMKRPLEAEFLSILIANKEFSPAVVLEPEDFLDPRHAAVFQALRRLKTDASPIALEREVKAIDPHFESEYLEVLISLDTGQEQTLESIEARAGQLREDHLRWKARSRLRGVVAKFDDPQAPLQDLLDAANEIVTSTGEGLLGQTKPTAPDILIRAYNQKQGVRFPTGLTAIDKNLSSEGMRHGQVWCLVAPYKGFKTVTALGIIRNLLRQGQSVAYVALEDSAIAFLETTLAIDSGVPIPIIERFHADKEPIHRKDYKAAVLESERWIQQEVGSRFRIYDADYGVHTWTRFPTLVASDKMLHNTDLVVVDHAQLWSEERETLEQIAQMLIRVAAERQVTILVLSQMSNDSIRNGTHTSLLATKNSGAFGAACHVGIEIKYDPESSPCRLTDELLKKINDSGVKHFVSMDGGPPVTGSRKTTGPSELVEVGLWMKTVRRGRRTRTMVLIDPLSGKPLLQYDDPISMEPW